MPGDFQVICGSIIGEIRRSLALTETPDCILTYRNCQGDLIWKIGVLGNSKTL